MKKLKLNLEDLKVESFETSSNPNKKGTIKGHELSINPTEPCHPLCETEPTNCGTCNTACGQHTCNQNDLTCDLISCPHTCGNTCDNTCNCTGPTDDYSCQTTCYGPLTCAP